MSDSPSNENKLRRVAGTVVFVSVTAFGLAQVSCVSKKNQQNSSLSSVTVASPEAVQQKLIVPGGLTPPKPQQGQGLLWFPFVWSPVIEQVEKASGLTPVENLFFRNPKLLLKNVATKEETGVALTEESASENASYQISQKELQKQLRFYFPRVYALNQGDYSVEGIRTEIGSQEKTTGTIVKMPFVNPFQSANNKPLIIKIREGRVSSIARVVQTTSIAESPQGLSLKTVSENLDSDVIPVGLVLRNLQKSSLNSLSNIISGTTDFPRLRVDVADEKTNSQSSDEQTARIGFLVDAPCTAKGRIRMVWKRQNDDKEYFSQFPIQLGEANCKDKQSYGFSFLVPVGDWTLKSTMIAPSENFQPQIQTSWLRSPGIVLKNYFSLSDTDFQWTLETQKEREIRRALIIPIESASRKFSEMRRSRDVFRFSRAGRAQGLLFLGHFDIRVSEATSDRAALWDFVLKSGFDLQRVQALLASTEVFNAYTLEKISNGRSNNSSIILRTAAEQDDRPSIAPVAAELQSESRKAYAACVKEREESDPLVNLTGFLQFTVLKGSDSINLKSMRSANDTINENWLEGCLKKSLIGFRFSRKSPANFQGELRFGKNL